MSIQDGLPCDPLTLELLDLLPVATNGTPSSPFTVEEWMDHVGDLSYYSGKSTCDRQNEHKMVHIGPYTLDGEHKIPFYELHC
jgi:hypothetical protein